jgi:hypothetical protein
VNRAHHHPAIFTVYPRIAVHADTTVSADPTGAEIGPTPAGDHDAKRGPTRGLPRVEPLPAAVWINPPTTTAPPTIFTHEHSLDS